MRLVFLLLVCVGSIAQTSGPAFDAASIRPSPPFDTSRTVFNFGPGGGPGTADPGRYSCHFCNVSQLIAQAYGLPEYRIFSASRLPEGRFDIFAVVPAGATREQMRMMIQHLLAERFKLAVHHESREMQTFRLLVAPSGPKLTAHVEDAPAVVERRADTGGRPPGVSYRVKGKTMTDFARAIAGQLHRPVTDATGLTGKYDFDLWWTMDDNPDAPNLSSAIRSLGLELKSRKEPVEILVIEHVEKSPTEN
jgi:uncharacterized protein (TIGR03435 family)